MVLHRSAIGLTLSMALLEPITRLAWRSSETSDIIIDESDWDNAVPSATAAVGVVVVGFGKLVSEKFGMQTCSSTVRGSGQRLLATPIKKFPN